MSRVLIIVQGGVVQSAYAESPADMVKLIDCDDLRADGHGTQFIDDLIEVATSDLIAVPVDGYEEPELTRRSFLVTRSAVVYAGDETEARELFDQGLGVHRPITTEVV